MKMSPDLSKVLRGIAAGIALAALLAGVDAIGQDKPAQAATPAKAPAQRTFDSPQAAANALIEAVRTGNRDALVQVVGLTSRSWLLTSDEVADRGEGQIFLEAYDRKNGIAMSGADKAMLTVGDDDWAFPAPIVRKGGKWSFDAAAGREEILNRRVGRNELDTIQTLLAIVDAQREYATQDVDGDGLNDYATRFASTPGTRDGLYWETPDGAPPSPLGPLVAKAVSEGYSEHVKRGKVEPYHGYLFRMLTSQGPHASGGAYDYIINGHLFGGFAAIAYPAEYGTSGVKSFIVNHEGVVYEKDLGTSSASVAAKVTSFDPGEGWTKAQ
jgi:hypothetical protein